MEELGINIERQHHEVATAGQAEIDFRFDTLVKTADNMMLYKYIIKNVARKHGKTVTFMPKPLYGDSLPPHSPSRQERVTSSSSIPWRKPWRGSKLIPMSWRWVRTAAAGPVGFDFSNSPVAVTTANLDGRVLVQRTTAGTRGVVAARSATRLWCASLVCASATAAAVRASGLGNPAYVITGNVEDNPT